MSFLAAMTEIQIDVFVSIPERQRAVQATVRFIFVVLSIISKQLLDGLLSCWIHIINIYHL